MESKSENTKLYKQLRTEHLVLKQQFEILQESFGMALDKIAELERRPAKELKKIPELERKLAKALKKISELERKPVEALKKISELERKLAQHDNAHTPSSKKAIGQKAKPQHGKPQQNGNGKSDTAKPRGGQKGHKGATYRPAPTRFERHAPDKCPRCGMSDLTVTKTSKRNVTEIPPPQKAVTTQHVLETCSCNVCGLGGIEPGAAPPDVDADGSEDVSESPQKTGPGAALPKRGNYGMNVILKVAENFLQRMPHRMSAKSLRRHLTRMSHGTVHNILCMTGTNLDAPARQILDLIRLARVLHVDETSLSLNGKLVWVWIFFDPETGNTLFVIRPSRGGDVLREVIPEWDGTIVSDGWSPYKKYRVQRCWAHILRIRHLAHRNPDCQEAQDALAVLSRVHRCGLRASGSMKKRRRLRSYLRRRVREILAKYADVAVLEKFMTKLGNAYGGSVPVRAGSADSVNQQRRGTRAARDSGAQEDTRIHQVKEHDAVAREPVLVRHDMAAARHRPSRRDRKIRLDGANTYGWRSAIFLRNSTSSSRCLRINLSNCSFLMSTFCLSLRYSVLAFLYSFL